MKENDARGVVHRCSSKMDVYRPTSDYSDLLKIVACYYEMYARAVDFTGPWIAKQRNGGIFIPPDREEMRAALGKERPTIHPLVRFAFVDAVIKFIQMSKGRQTLITPSPSSHHSAQFSEGTFEISAVTPQEAGGILAKNGCELYKINFFGATSPVFFHAQRFNCKAIKFIILRPKLGKLGTPSVVKWETLMFKQSIGYLVDHTDSHLNPSYSGRF